MTLLQQNMIGQKANFDIVLVYSQKVHYNNYFLVRLLDQFCRDKRIVAFPVRELFGKHICVDNLFRRDAEAALVKQPGNRKMGV